MKKKSIIFIYGVYLYILGGQETILASHVVTNHNLGQSCQILPRLSCLILPNHGHGLALYCLRRFLQDPLSGSCQNDPLARAKVGSWGKTEGI